MVLQESDMFMDALTASTKSKEPRKRKRRTSITKDGPTEAKKQETANSDNRDVTPPPTSPPSADEKSPVVVKPNFKVYIIIIALMMKINTCLIYFYTIKIFFLLSFIKIR